MRGQRITVALHFLVLVVAFPRCFLTLREVVEAFLSGFTVDDQVCLWLDGVLRLPTTLDPKAAEHVLARAVAGGSHRWLVEVTTGVPTLWCLRFFTGAVEEVRYGFGAVRLLEVLEVFGRWVAMGALTLVIAPLVAVVFFHSIRFVLWEPLGFLVAMGLFSFLFFWGWQYPNRRLRHVEKIYHFERLKQGGGR
jgi:hypothetical protein